MKLEFYVALSTVVPVLLLSSSLSLFLKPEPATRRLDLFASSIAMWLTVAALAANVVSLMLAMFALAGQLKLNPSIDQYMLWSAVGLLGLNLAVFVIRAIRHQVVLKT